MAFVFPVVFIALWVGHQVGDHWVQTSDQAARKGGPGWDGRLACLVHVLSLTLTQAVFLGAADAMLGLRLGTAPVFAGFAVNAVTHYWADRRTTLAGLCDRLGKGGFYRLGVPRDGRDDNPSLGTGAYALDQSWHIGWLFVAALVASM